MPAEDVKRRYWRSLENLFSYIKLCGTIITYDTTDGSMEEFSRTVARRMFMIYNEALFDRFYKKVIEAQNEH